MMADGHLGMTALSRVTLASAGLSCFLTYYVHAYSLFVNNVMWFHLGSVNKC